MIRNPLARAGGFKHHEVLQLEAEQLNPLARAGGFKLVDQRGIVAGFGTRSQERVDLSKKAGKGLMFYGEPARKSGWI